METLSLSSRSSIFSSDAMSLLACADVSLSRSNRATSMGVRPASAPAVGFALSAELEAAGAAGAENAEEEEDEVVLAAAAAVEIAPADFFFTGAVSVAIDPPGLGRFSPFLAATAPPTALVELVRSALGLATLVVELADADPGTVSTRGPR